MKLAPQVNTALELLEAAGYEAYLVGGAVRDFVRDNSPAKDWDIATNALPEQVKEVFAGFRLIETGLKHGTVTVVIGRIPLEITTYRVDGDYLDHRWGPLYPQLEGGPGAPGLHDERPGVSPKGRSH